MPGHPAGRAEEAAHDGSSVAVVASAHGIGSYPLRKVLMVFPGEEKGGGHGLIDIAGGAEFSPNDFEVVFVFPAGGFAG